MKLQVDVDVQNTDEAVYAAEYVRAAILNGDTDGEVRYLDSPIGRFELLQPQPADQ
jgi:hypothetical protein